MARKRCGRRKTTRFGLAGGTHTGTRSLRAAVSAKYSCSHDGGTKVFLRRDQGSLEKSRYVVVRGKAVTKIVIKKIIPKQSRPNGYRMMDLTLLQEHMSQLATHVCTCPQASLLAINGDDPIKIVGEKKSYGLASQLCVKCQGCLREFTFPSSRRQESGIFDVNFRAVWGAMVTGGGCSQLEELMATLNSPSLSVKSFSAIEEKIGELWKTILEEDLLAAGREERKLAEERGDFFGGVPAISVICDGGWSKRSHRHSYSALGGVAIIIGAATGKLLHIGVRNKYCPECAAADRTGTAPPEHVCFKNWDKSSQAMEADAILEGFQKAETMHGLRYMRLIADGDSSVYATIRENVPVWGPYVEKMECANHACKCLRSNLEKLVADKPHYKGKGRLTEKTRVRLAVAVRCAIRMRSQCESRSEGIRQLKHDILNSVHHVFDNHSNCSDFCKVRYPDSNASPTKIDHEDTRDPPVTASLPGDEIGSIFGENATFWRQTTSEGDVRAGGDEPHEELTAEMLKDVSILLNRVAAKAERLLGNFTTNLAESWMAIRTKFDGGKRVNRCASGSWHARCYGAGLRRNLGAAWSPLVWEQTTRTEPGDKYLSVYRSKALTAEAVKIRQSRPESKKRRFELKHRLQKQSTSNEAKQSYGPMAKQVVAELEPPELDRVKGDFLKENIYVAEDTLKVIEMNTIGQTSSPLWNVERKKRLTSSNFHSIVVRRPTIPVAPLVTRLVYSSFSGTSATRFGLREEASARQEYVLFRRSLEPDVMVKEVGLKIDRAHPYLASSADGLVFENGKEAGLVEIKHVLHNKTISLEDAAAAQASFCLSLVDGKLCLKKTHPFYYQCQGQCNIYKLPWVDLVVRAVHPYQFHVERIERDVELWEQTMLPKLHAFYHKAILPELAAPRHGKYPGIREPGIWFDTPSTRKGKRSVARRVSEVVHPLTTVAPGDVQLTSSPTLLASPAGRGCPEPHSVSVTKSPKVTPSIHVSPISGLSPGKSPTSGPRDAKPALGSTKACHSADVSSPRTPSSIGKQATVPVSPLGTVQRARPGRVRRVKFVGRRISHQWEGSGSDLTWYEGTVTEVLLGEDGDEDALYEVLYEDDDDPYEVDDLLKDFCEGTLVFIDIW